MLVKIIIGFFIIGIIEDYWDNKMKKEKHKKRKYRFIKGLVYSAAAIISYFLAGYVDKFIYVYAAVFVIGGIGSVLSTINPNLREMYSIGLVVFPTIWVISFYYESHKTIFTIIDVLLILTFLGAVGQGISNIKSGIDPDVEEEKNKKKWGRKLKRVKWFIKFWRWMG